MPGEGRLAMKDIYDVLRQKETDLERVRGEIEALRFVIPLLTESSFQPMAAAEAAVSRLPHANKWPLQIGDSHAAPGGFEPV